MSRPTIIRPQPGPQEMFARCPADVVFYGGAAGGGKTFSMLLECARHVDKPGWMPLMFRRVSPQITNPGGLWDDSHKVLAHLAGGQPVRGMLEWRFPSGAKVAFRHLQYESNVNDYQGAQSPLIIFDELTHFTRRQFLYMLSRARSSYGFHCRVLAGMNPCDPENPDEAWILDFVRWYVDMEGDGRPIPGRAGVIRHFVVVDGEVRWVEEGDTSHTGERPLSFAFIPAELADNLELTKVDPSYGARLASLTLDDQERLRKGRWNVATKGELFKNARWSFIDEAPSDLEWVRYWDQAATEATKKNPKPDYTAGALIATDEHGVYIRDCAYGQWGPAEKERRIRETAEMDGPDVEIVIEEEPGASGKTVVSDFQTRVLAGFTVWGDRPTGDKQTRTRPLVAMAERGNVHLVRGPWNAFFVRCASRYPKKPIDPIDAAAGGYGWLVSRDVPVQQDVHADSVDGERWNDSGWSDFGDMM